MQTDFDLVVIGAGSGGVRAARVAAELGARVAIVEAGAFGGTCVNAGCIPKKLLVYGAELGRDLADARGFGWADVERGFDWPTLLARKDAEVARLNQAYLRTLENAGVEILRGRAHVLAPDRVQVGERELRSRYLLIATGSAPVLPDIPGCEHAITSDGAFHLAALPRRIAIVGAGYVGLEFAGIFHGLGARVHVIQRSGQILSGFDADLRDQLARELRTQGLDLRCGLTVRAIARAGAELQLQLSNGAALRVDHVLVATGRAPNTRGLGLEQAGVALGDAGAVHVDDYGRSSVASIFAVGDCTGRAQLTPVAIADGQAAAHTMFGEPRRCVERTKVATALFSQPPVASVGLSEEEARALFGEVDVYRARFTPLKHRVSGRDVQSLVKLVVDPSTQRVLGYHMVGEGAPEIMQGFAVALQCGATIAQLQATVPIHPTSAEELITLQKV
jgi:glutathione reductase (NADPH)